MLFYRSALQPGLGGDKGIPFVRLSGCCARWFACMMFLSRGARDLLHRISVTWINVFCDMKLRTLGGEPGMRPKEADDWAMCSQVAFKYKAFHETAWPSERHNASIRSALQRAETQVIEERLCVSPVIALGWVPFMHDPLVSINNLTLYQPLQGRRPHLFPPLECGCHGGGLDIKGQNNI